MSKICIQLTESTRCASKIILCLFGSPSWQNVRLYFLCLHLCLSNSFWLVTAISGFIQLISSPYDTHSDWLQLSLVSSSWNRHLMTLILIGYSYLWFHPVDIVTLWHSFWLVTAISGFIQLISSPSDHENQVKC
jgi:membrane glycosyltransferase